MITGVALANHQIAEVYPANFLRILMDLLMEVVSNLAAFYFTKGLANFKTPRTAFSEPWVYVKVDFRHHKSTQSRGFFSDWPNISDAKNLPFPKKGQKKMSQESPFGQEYSYRLREFERSEDSGGAGGDGAYSPVRNGKSIRLSSLAAILYT